MKKTFIVLMLAVADFTSASNHTRQDIAKCFVH